MDSSLAAAHELQVRDRGFRKSVRRSWTQSYLYLARSMWALYQDVLGNVEPQVAQLRAIFRQARDKRTERSWKKNCSDGELDDTRLVEGIAGERHVFKKRGEVERRNRPEDGRRRWAQLISLCTKLLHASLVDEMQPSLRGQSGAYAS